MKMKIEEVINTPWILIEYRSSYSSGRIIIKEGVWNLKNKKFLKVLKDCEYKIINPYTLKVNEFVGFDEEYNHLLRYKERLYHYYDYEKKHGENSNETLKRIRSNDKAILTRLTELNKIYKKEIKHV